MPDAGPATPSLPPQGRPGGSALWSGAAPQMIEEDSDALPSPSRLLIEDTIPPPGPKQSATKIPWKRPAIQPREAEKATREAQSTAQNAAQSVISPSPEQNEKPRHASASGPKSMMSTLIESMSLSGSSDVEELPKQKPKSRAKAPANASKQAPKKGTKATLGGPQTKKGSQTNKGSRSQPRSRKAPNTGPRAKPKPKLPALPLSAAGDENDVDDTYYVPPSPKPKPKSKPKPKVDRTKIGPQRTSKAIHHLQGSSSSGEAHSPSRNGDGPSKTSRARARRAKQSYLDEDEAGHPREDHAQGSKHQASAGTNGKQPASSDALKGKQPLYSSTETPPSHSESKETSEYIPEEILLSSDDDDIYEIIRPYEQQDALPRSETPPQNARSRKPANGKSVDDKRKQTQRTTASPGDGDLATPIPQQSGPSRPIKGVQFTSVTTTTRKATRTQPNTEASPGVETQTPGSLGHTSAAGPPDVKDQRSCNAAYKVRAEDRHAQVQTTGTAVASTVARTDAKRKALSELSPNAEPQPKKSRLDGKAPAARVICSPHPPPASPVPTRFREATDTGVDPFVVPHAGGKTETEPTTFTRRLLSNASAESQELPIPQAKGTGGPTGVSHPSDPSALARRMLQAFSRPEPQQAHASPCDGEERQGVPSNSKATPDPRSGRQAAEEDAQHGIRMWKEATDPYDNICHTMSLITKKLVRYLKSKEDAIGDVADEYRQRGSHVLGKMEERHKKERDRAAEDLKKQQTAFALICQDARLDIRNLSGKLASDDLEMIMGGLRKGRTVERLSALRGMCEYTV